MSLVSFFVAILSLFFMTAALDGFLFAPLSFLGALILYLYVTSITGPAMHVSLMNLDPFICLMDGRKFNILIEPLPGAMPGLFCSFI